MCHTVYHISSSSASHPYMKLLTLFEISVYVSDISQLTLYKGNASAWHKLLKVGDFTRLMESHEAGIRCIL